jgi:hypothetical protein
MTPIQTSFSFPTTHPGAPRSCLSPEPCGHIPSPDELMAAPFYPDRSQRILALSFGRHNTFYVINMELLLELAREREGRDVGWDEWGAHTIEIHVGDPDSVGEIWTSGCRLFYTVSSVDDDDPTHLLIYDFSHAGRAKYLRTLDRANEGGGTRRMSPCLGYRLPWNSFDSHYGVLTTGHDSIVFCIVSILICLSTSSQLNERFFVRCSVQDQEHGQFFEPSTKAALHVWSL